MAGAMRKVGEYLGLVEQADFDDEYDAEFDAPDEEPEPQRAPAKAQPARPAAVTSIESRRAERRRAPVEPTTMTAASEMARIETVTPRTYNDARTVGEHFRSGVPVIMNLSEIDDADAKRLVDFGAGLVFSVHGSINRITAKVFLLSPSSITVTDEDKQRLAVGGFYNQN